VQVDAEDESNGVGHGGKGRRWRLAGGAAPGRRGGSRIEDAWSRLRDERRIIGAGRRAFERSAASFERGAAPFERSAAPLDARAAVFAGGSAGLVSGDLRVGQAATPFLYTRWALEGGAGRASDTSVYLWMVSTEPGAAHSIYLALSAAAHGYQNLIGKTWRSSSKRFTSSSPYSELMR
jgi:hypothetical protein